MSVALRLEHIAQVNDPSVDAPELNLLDRGVLVVHVQAPGEDQADLSPGSGHPSASEGNERCRGFTFAYTMRARSSAAPGRPIRTSSKSSSVSSRHSYSPNSTAIAISAAARRAPRSFRWVRSSMYGWRTSRTRPRPVSTDTGPLARSARSLADRGAAGAADRAPRRDAPSRRGRARSRYRTSDGDSVRKDLGAHGVDRKSRMGYPGGQPSCHGCTVTVSSAPRHTSRRRPRARPRSAPAGPAPSPATALRRAAPPLPPPPRHPSRRPPRPRPGPAPAGPAPSPATALRRAAATLPPTPLAGRCPIAAARRGRRTGTAAAPDRKSTPLNS